MKSRLRSGALETRHVDGQPFALQDLLSHALPQAAAACLIATRCGMHGYYVGAGGPAAC
jgi:hypothetical protein